MREINQYIDFTNLDINASEKEIKKLSEIASLEGFHSVCIRAKYLEFFNRLNLNCKVSIVIGFPEQKFQIETEEELKQAKFLIGNIDLNTKIQETIYALEHNANELDPVIKISILEEAKLEIESICQVLYDFALQNPDKIFWLKPIFSCEILTETELEESIKIFSKIVNDFYSQNPNTKNQIKFAYKNSTGYISSSKLKLKTSSPELISKISKYLGKYDPNKNIYIKAAGGIRDLETAEAIISAAEDRLSHIGSSRLLI